MSESANDYKNYLGDSFDYKTNELDSDTTEIESLAEKDKIRIVVAGASGVGKSALINAIFGDDVAESSHGKPVTQNIMKFDMQEKGLILWDTKGIEAKDYKKTIKELTDGLDKEFFEQQSFFASMLTIGEKKKTSDYPDIAWLCINHSSSRLEPREDDIIKILANFNIPIVVVFTKTFMSNANAFVDYVKEEFTKKYPNNTIGYVCVNSMPTEISPGHIIPAKGLDELINISATLIKDSEVLQRTQIVDSKLKLESLKKRANKIVENAIEAATSTDDENIKKAIQSKMIYKLNSEFELSANDAHVAEFVPKLIGVSFKSRKVLSIAKHIPTPNPQINMLVSFLDNQLSKWLENNSTKIIGYVYIKLLLSCYDQQTNKVILPSVALMLDSFSKLLPSGETQDAIKTHDKN